MTSNSLQTRSWHECVQHGRGPARVLPDGTVYGIGDSVVCKNSCELSAADCSRSPTRAQPDDVYRVRAWRGNSGFELAESLRPDLEVFVTTEQLMNDFSPAWCTAVPSVQGQGGANHAPDAIVASTAKRLRS